MNGYLHRRGEDLHRRHAQRARLDHLERPTPELIDRAHGPRPEAAWGEHLDPVADQVAHRVAHLPAVLARRRAQVQQGEDVRLPGPELVGQSDGARPEALARADRVTLEVFEPGLGRQDAVPGLQRDLRGELLLAGRQKETSPEKGSEPGAKNPWGIVNSSLNEKTVDCGSVSKRSKPGGKARAAGAHTESAKHAATRPTIQAPVALER